jgi:hypothetical protein
MQYLGNRLSLAKMSHKNYFKNSCRLGILIEFLKGKKNKAEPWAGSVVAKAYTKTTKKVVPFQTSTWSNFAPFWA